MPQYGEKEYWDTRYSQQKEKTFDWLENWEALKPVVEKLITPESRILMLG